MRNAPPQDHGLEAGRRTQARAATRTAMLLALAAGVTACMDSEPVGVERETAPAPEVLVRQGTLVKPGLRIAPSGLFRNVGMMGTGLMTRNLAVPTAATGDLSVYAAATEDLTVHTAEDIANALVGAGVTISNVAYTGVPPAAGLFSGGDGIIGFDDGIILSSGDIAFVQGPNTSSGITANNGTSGDAALTSLSGYPTYDASILEFDFVPDADQVFFQYVFASEEYNEWVYTQYNDVFAFWVNGVNCAVVGDGEPVSINTINAGNPIGSDPSNPELYINNDPFDGGVAEADLLDTEMDGLTVVLTCQAAVSPGETNTMRLAIADAGDAILDSNVFIKSGSLTTTPPGDDPPPPPPPPSDATEGCTPGFWSQNGVRTEGYPVGYAPEGLVGSLFEDAAGYLGDATLLQALQGYPGSSTRRNTLEGAMEILLRHAVAAVLNEAKFGAHYPAESVPAIQVAVAAALGSGDRATILGLADQYDLWNNNMEVDPATGELVEVGMCPL